MSILSRLFSLPTLVNTLADQVKLTGEQARKLAAVAQTLQERDEQIAVLQSTVAGHEQERQRWHTASAEQSEQITRLIEEREAFKAQGLRLSHDLHAANTTAEQVQQALTQERDTALKTLADVESALFRTSDLLRRCYHRLAHPGGDRGDARTDRLALVAELETVIERKED